MGEGSNLMKETIKRETPEGFQGKTDQRLDLLRIVCLCI